MFSAPYVSYHEMKDAMNGHILQTVVGELRVRRRGSYVIPHGDPTAPRIERWVLRTKP